MKAQTVQQVLEAGLWMIENIGWCQKHYEIFDDSSPPVPRAFCATGALTWVETEYKCGSPLALDDLKHQAEDLLNKVAQSMGYHSIIELNDYSSYALPLVIAVYQDAIKQAKERNL